MHKLRTWLDDNRVSVPEFAEQVGVTRAAVYAWLKGRAAPSRGRMGRVRDATNGFVDAADWLPAEDAA